MPFPKQRRNRLQRMQQLYKLAPARTLTRSGPLLLRADSFYGSWVAS